mmetsp:Transcript_10438/g.29026  ORF Transcript_10438/g.29026 Transcript_10438/m.29026 type:complete len:536 (-) Transcript_10438:104-1711(-)
MPAAVDFAVEPLSEVAVEILRGTTPEERETAVVLALRPGPLAPYALPVVIPQPDHALRERGLALLWSRAVSVAAAVVGTSHLRLVTEYEETFQRLAADFRSHVVVTEHLKQYGDALTLERAPACEVPAQLRAMPFSRGKAETCAAPQEPIEPIPQKVRTDAVEASCRLFVGVDYGRSDVKCAVVDAAGKELSTYVTRWWLPEDGSLGAKGERRYLDPAVMTSIQEPLRCLGEAALEAVAKALEPGVAGGRPVICGLGLSAAGCVRDGRLCGIPPSFGGCRREEAAPVLAHLELTILDYLRSHAAERLGGRVIVDGSCSTLLVNDGDASAMWGASGLARATATPEGPKAVGLFLSCGTGLAGGIVQEGGLRCQGGVLELGKLVMGLPRASGGEVPVHDTLRLPGAAQGLAGTQRSFFNLLAARGGQRLEGKAEQRAVIIAMQKRPLDHEVEEIFRTLGEWLARFVLELSEYLPFQLTDVEVGGKLTDAASGEVMLQCAAEVLKVRGITRVRRAEESEFGQALAVAEGARAERVGRS